MGEVCGYNISMKIKAIFKEGLMVLSQYLPISK